MSMHLEGPWLSTTGKQKGKRKFTSAAAAKRARELAQEWERNQERWAAMSPNFSKGIKTKPKAGKISSPVVSNSPFVDPSRDHRQYPSRDTGQGIAAAMPKKVYTGTMIKGIGTMHKSNAVPIFTDEEAQDISRMRR